MTDTPVSVGIRTVPASQGLRWIRLGLRAFGRQPGGFMGLFGLFLLLMLALSLLLAPLQALGVETIDPLLFQALGVVVLPLLSLGFMLGSEAVTNDLRIRPWLLFAPLAASAATRRTLLAIGLVYVAVWALFLVSGNDIDHGEVIARFRGQPVAVQDAAGVAAPGASATVAAVAASQSASSAAASSSAATASTADAESELAGAAALPPLSDAGALVLLLKMAIIAIGSIPLWHAPALALWGRHGAAKAMFGSVVALWRTRGAFAMFMLGWLGIGFVFFIVLTLLGALLSVVPFVLVALFASWTLTAMFYATLWFGFTDTFEIASPAARRSVTSGTEPPTA